MLRRGLLGLVHQCLPIGGGDKQDGFDPSACQTYRDVDQFLTEPDEEKLFGAIKAGVVTCVMSCRVSKEGSSKPQDKWSDFLDDYPTIEELKSKEAFGTIRSQVTIAAAWMQRRLCLRLRVVGQWRWQPQVQRARVAAAEAEVQLREQSSMSTLTSRNSRPCPSNSSQLLKSFVTCNRGSHQMRGITPKRRRTTKTKQQEWK